MRKNHLLNVDNVQLILNEVLLQVNLMSHGIQFPVLFQPRVKDSNILRRICNTWKHLDLNNIFSPTSPFSFTVFICKSNERIPRLLTTQRFFIFFWLPISPVKIKISYISDKSVTFPLYIISTSKVS